MLRRLFAGLLTKRKPSPPHYRSWPELVGLPPDEQDRVWAASVRQAWRRPGIWVLVVVGLAMFLGQLAAIRLLIWWAAAAVMAYCPWFPDRLLSLVVVPVALLPALVSLSSVIVIAPRLIRCYVPRCLPGHCPCCGYDLRATPGRCPECGTVPAGGPDRLMVTSAPAGRSSCSGSDQPPRNA